MHIYEIKDLQAAKHILNDDLQSDQVVAWIIKVHINEIKDLRAATKNAQLWITKWSGSSMNGRSTYQGDKRLTPCTENTLTKSALARMVWMYILVIDTYELHNKRYNMQWFYIIVWIWSLCAIRNIWTQSHTNCRVSSGAWQNIMKQIQNGYQICMNSLIRTARVWCMECVQKGGAHECEGCTKHVPTAAYRQTIINVGSVVKSIAVCVLRTSCIRVVQWTYEHISEWETIKCNVRMAY